MVFAFLGLGPTELVLGMLCLGVVVGGIVVAVVLATRSTSKDSHLSALEAENDRLRLELENQKLRDELERRKN